MTQPMSPVRIAFGTLGYLVITFPLAYIWHLVAFKQTYDDLGYFSRDEPIIVFGFSAILLQGLLLAVIYPLLCRGRSLISGALMLAALMGGYHWTGHVMAAAAKHEIAPLSTWFMLETLYLAIQFLLGGFMLAFIYRSQTETVAESIEARELP